MGWVGATIGLLASAPDSALADEVATPAERPQKLEGVVGFGINNVPGVLLGASGILPALSLKAFGERTLFTFDVAAIGNAVSGEAATIVLTAIGLERAVHTLGSGHFFIRPAVYFDHWDTSLDIGEAGNFLNAGLSGGFEYIFEEGLPGLGIGADYGMSASVVIPTDGETFVQLRGRGIGVGSSFENFLLLSVRYYFLDTGGATDQPVQIEEVGPRREALPRREDDSVADPIEATGRVLFEVLARSGSLDEKCHRVAVTLATAAQCADQQCVAPHAVAEQLVARCESVADSAVSTEVAQVDQLRERWAASGSKDPARTVSPGAGPGGAQRGSPAGIQGYLRCIARSDSEPYGRSPVGGACKPIAPRSKTAFRRSACRRSVSPGCGGQGSGRIPEACVK